ncbi:hypothetical protein C8R45DRAFT_999094 [Mycena sanguinolenta]|nr:hypothetical protein C8R45DRAFT_999094 [Mycena sanguinolenta]
MRVLSRSVARHSATAPCYHVGLGSPVRRGWNSLPSLRVSFCLVKSPHRMLASSALRLINLGRLFTRDFAQRRHRCASLPRLLLPLQLPINLTSHLPRTPTPTSLSVPVSSCLSAATSRCESSSARCGWSQFCSKVTGAKSWIFFPGYVFVLFVSAELAMLAYSCCLGIQ